MNKFLSAIIGLLLFIAYPVTTIALECGATELVANAMGIVSIPFAYYLIKQLPSVNLGIPNLYRNAVEVEVWTEHIASNIFKGIAFIKRSFDASKYVLVGKVVHIPQAGAKPVVVKNRSSLPAVAIVRGDTDVTYAFDEYTTDPVRIEDAANVQLSYDKMDDVLNDHESALSVTYSDNMLITWAPTQATRISRSTGTSSTVNAYMPLATGTRRAYTLADLAKVQSAMNKASIPKKGRVCVMSEDAWLQLQADFTPTTNKDFSSYFNASEGRLANAPDEDCIGRLYGFDIYTTPSTVVYDNATTPALRAYGATGTATDNDAILCWHERFVERGVGEIKFFGQENSPLYYGDVYSALVRAGGRKRYNDETGVYAIVQGV